MFTTTIDLVRRFIRNTYPSPLPEVTHINGLGQQRSLSHHSSCSCKGAHQDAGGGSLVTVCFHNSRVILHVFHIPGLGCPSSYRAGWGRPWLTAEHPLGPSSLHSRASIPAVFRNSQLQWGWGSGSIFWAPGGICSQYPAAQASSLRLQSGTPPLVTSPKQMTGFLSHTSPATAGRACW